MPLVLLPGQLHLILRLPGDDADFTTRVAAIKAGFTDRWLPDHPEDASARDAAVSASRRRQRYRDVWQKRFWEHWIREPADL